MSENEYKTHESYGLLGFSRITSSHGETLFGSSIKHNNIISMRIKRAEKKRHLSRNWYCGTEELIEVQMSYTQFTEAITAMNVGSGVPVTIKHVNHKRMERPPFDNVREKLNQEFKDDIDGAFGNSRKAIQKAQELLSSKNHQKKLRKKTY